MDNLIKEKLKEIEEVNSINIRELRGVTIFEVNAKEDQDTHEKNQRTKSKSSRTIYEIC